MNILDKIGAVVVAVVGYTIMLGPVVLVIIGLILYGILYLLSLVIGWPVFK
jgi:hypothetical protein